MEGERVNSGSNTMDEMEQVIRIFPQKLREELRSARTGDFLGRGDPPSGRNAAFDAGRGERLVPGRWTAPEMASPQQL